MPFTERLLQHLVTNGPQSISQLLLVLPELAATSQAEQTLRLLLRLDRRVRPLADGRWGPVLNALTPEQRIIFSTKSYLSKIPGGGASLGSTVEQVMADTGYERALIQFIISQRFSNNGRVVRNQLK
jgi:hypothetical protein